MNYLILLAILIVIIVLIINNKKNYLCNYKNNGKVIGKVISDNNVPIKRSTPDVVVLETPMDKSYKNFCNICKKSVDKIMVNGACSSCHTPLVPK
jgi:hypothetical protein